MPGANHSPEVGAKGDSRPRVAMPGELTSTVQGSFTTASAFTKDQTAGWVALAIGRSATNGQPRSYNECADSSRSMDYRIDSSRSSVDFLLLITFREGRAWIGSSAGTSWSRPGHFLRRRSSPRP